MDTYTARWWRIPTRVIAYLDLFSEFISIGILIWYLIQTCLLLTQYHPDDLFSSWEGFCRHLGAPLLLLLIPLVCESLQLWAAIRLIKATNAEVEPINSLLHAYFWVEVNLITFIIGAILVFWIGLPVAVAVGLLIQGSYMVIVAKYILELKNCLIFGKKRMQNVISLVG